MILEHLQWGIGQWYRSLCLSEKLAQNVKLPKSHKDTGGILYDIWLVTHDKSKMSGKNEVS